MIYYILDSFPNLTENFILREILTLKKLGKEITIIVLSKPSVEKISRQCKLLQNNVIYVQEFSWLKKIMVALKTCFIHPLLMVKLNLSLLVDFVYSPRLMYHRWRGALNAMTIADEAGEMPKHVHAHFAFVTTDLAKVLADIAGCKWSVSAHAWEIFTKPAKILKRRIDTADRIFVCSKHGQQNLCEKIPGLKDKITLMYHGIDNLEFEGKPAEGNILAIGRLEAKKGFDVLIQAGKILADQGIEPEFTIIGDGPLKSSLISQVKQEGLKNFSFSGNLPFETVKEKLSISEMLVQPSVITPEGDRDGIPNVLIEAMAMSKPVIASEIGGIPELISNGSNGVLVPPGETEKLADAIKKLIKDKDYAHQLGVEARKQVEANFESLKNIQPLKEYYP